MSVVRPMVSVRVVGTDWWATTLEEIYEVRQTMNSHEGPALIDWVRFSDFGLLDPGDAAMVKAGQMNEPTVEHLWELMGRMVVVETEKLTGWLVAMDPKTMCPQIYDLDHISTLEIAEEIHDANVFMSEQAELEWEANGDDDN